MSFAIGYVHDGRPRHEFMESVWHVMLAAKGDPGNEVVVIPVRSGPNLSRKRNEVLERFLAIEKPQLDGLLMVDTDIVFSLDDVKAIIQSEYPITSGLYFNPDADGGVFPVFNIGYRFLRVGNEDDLHAAFGKPFEVAGVGMGFCYIQRNVIEALAPDRPLWPFAEYVTDDGIPVGEDVGFCLRARDKKFWSYVDPRIEVGHIKEHVIG